MSLQVNLVIILSSYSVDHHTSWFIPYSVTTNISVYLTVECYRYANHPPTVPLYLCPSDSTCMSKCPVSYYAEDKDERSCERCHFSCQSCVGRHSVQCVTCKPGFFKQGISCVEVCSERFGELKKSPLVNQQRTSQTKPPHSFSVTLPTPPPWFASDVTPLAASVGVGETETV